MATVRRRAAARRDVVEIAVWIARDNKDAAYRFLDAVDADARKLAAMPGMGPAREFSNPKLEGLRSWPVTGFRNYLIFYRKSRGGITIVRVLHGARDLERVLAGG
jgi:toxin ParE1/3/4